MVISGIIRPPPDIRAVADRTALFVSKNGRAFELKILNSEKGKTPKFAFLHETSPFHAYYENRIRFYEEGGTDEEEKKKEAEEKLRIEKEKAEAEKKAMAEKEEADTAASQKREALRKKASAVDPIARALVASRTKIADARRRAHSASNLSATPNLLEEGRTENSKLERPPAEENAAVPPSLRHVSVVAPANLKPIEIERIKITAQFVALSEQGLDGAAAARGNFLSSLTLREWTNPEFMFLQPRHAHFSYFTALVDGYRSFLPGGESFDKAQKKLHIDTKKKTSSPHLNEQPRNQLDICLTDAAYRAEYEREAAERRREAIQFADGGGVFGGSGTVDWHDFVVVETINFPVDEVVEALPPPTSLRLAALNKELAKGHVVEEGEDEKQKDEDEDEDDEMDQSSSDEDMEDDEAGERLKVVSDYQPKVVSTSEITGDASRTHIIDPITGKSIAAADMPEHMRIQLLDPKWAAERRRFLEKQRETNFVAGDDIASNITRFAQARGDIFGSSDDQINDLKADSERRLMEANQIIRQQAMQQPQTQLQPQNMPVPSITSPPPLPGAPLSQPLNSVASAIQTATLPMVAATPLPLPLHQQQADQPRAINKHLEEPSEPPPAKRYKAEGSLSEPNTSLATSMTQVTDVSVSVPPPPMLAAHSNTNATLSSISTSVPQELLPEADFIATLPNPDQISFFIQIPKDPSNFNWNFNGQTIELTSSSTSKIKDAKETLRSKLGGMPTNKMQLKHPVFGFMNKDALSLGHFNVRPGMTLDLVQKVRGGRK